MNAEKDLPREGTFKLRLKDKEKAKIWLQILKLILKFTFLIQRKMQLCMKNLRFLQQNMSLKNQLK